MKQASPAVNNNVKLEAIHVLELIEPAWGMAAVKHTTSRLIFSAVSIAVDSRSLLIEHTSARLRS